jgi:hypothetical protein
MVTTLSKLFSDELDEWSHSVNIHMDDTDILEKKLTSVIRRDSIPGIASQVENHMHHLEKISGILQTLRYDMQEQETLLQAYKHKQEDDKLNKVDVEKKQAILRLNMQAAEKEFIDVKFGCYDFIADSLKK